MELTTGMFSKTSLSIFDSNKASATSINKSLELVGKILSISELDTFWFILTALMPFAKLIILHLI